MRTHSIIFSVVLLLVASFGDTTIAQESLRWKLEKGAKYELQMKQQTNSLVTLSSKKLNSTVDLQVNVGWEVTSADTDQFVIEQTIESIRIEMKGADQNVVSYDSREKKAIVGAAKDLAGAVTPLLGAKFKLTMNGQGVVSATERISSPNAEGTPAGDAPKTTAVSKEAVEQLLSQSLLPLPKEALDKDQSWTDERQTKAALGEVKLKRTFTIGGMEDRGGKPAMKIDVKGELEITPATGTKPLATLRTQSHTGSVWFAKEAGRFVASETTQRLVTESMYRDSTIGVDLTTTLTTTLTAR